MSQAQTARTVACPSCGAPSLYATTNPWRPFCSQRCRELDLGAWASEGYRMPDPAPTEGEAEAPSAPH